MKNKITVMVLIISLSLGACSTNGSEGMGAKETVGAWLGALTGGYLGSKVGKGSGQLLATGAGAALGAIAGSNIGKQLDRVDLMYHQQAIESSYSAPLDKTIQWENEENGHSGTVTPVREGRQAYSGNLCRQYEQTIRIEDKEEIAIGTACQNDDGTWTIAK